MIQFSQNFDLVCGKVLAYSNGNNISQLIVIERKHKNKILNILARQKKIEKEIVTVLEKSHKRNHVLLLALQSQPPPLNNLTQRLICEKNSRTLFSNPNTSRTRVSYSKPRTKTSGTCFGEVIRRPTTTIQLVSDFHSLPR